MTTKVINVTPKQPKGRTHGIIFAIGLIIEALGWLTVVSTAIAGASILFMVVVALAFVWGGRRLRRVQ